MITIDKISFIPENLDNISVKFQPNSGQNLFLFEFLKNWFHEKYSFSIYTSGTTSFPKHIILKKSSLVASAIQTIESLNLKNENILCCIPTEKIGGLMMVVRALIGGFDITVNKPTADPMEEIDQFHNFTFVSLVPYQLQNILSNSESLKKLNRFKHVLLGGAQLNSDLLLKIENLKPDIFHSFGMTETCSNFALRKLNNGKWNYFKPYNDVKIKIDKSGILSVKGKQTDEKWIKTNDIASIHDDGFEFIGRNDFVINTGGFKVSPEFLENKIQNFLLDKKENSQFLITSQMSEDWGQTVILAHNDKQTFENTNFQNTLKSNLEKHEMPKKFIFLENLPLNKSMKIDRKAVHSLVSKL